ncbi:hypothetical protein BJV82DRAFT_674477 [Fennellomyces sp. T-0311]|nr:hypothetical protein BJV82DRAFT_674477 [Fennellomyces sp. T-0311]
MAQITHAAVIVVATNETYIDRVAAFGPRLTEEGLVGRLLPPTNDGDRYGCEPVTPPTDNWVALIERGECSFVDKVRAMQESGALAAVVGDKHYNGWITMYAPGDTSDVQIPSVFVAQHQYQALLQLARSFREPMLVRLVKDDMLTWYVSLSVILFNVVLSPAVMMLFIYLTWRLRQRQRRKNELAPTDFVTKLPVRKYRREKQADNDHAECAICLEDYVDGDTLRTLPCRHEFHTICVDAWLTTHKKFCPICKHDICRKTPESSTERTPLLNA